MSFFSSLVMPLFVCLIFGMAVANKVDILSAFSKGVMEGLRIVLDMFPALMLLTIAVGMLRSSGGLELLCKALARPADIFGIPQPIIPLTLLRPLSGSGALVVFQDILSQHGPDSFVGKIAAVMMGSTETTFYTIALYCSAAKIKRTRYAAPASLCADLTGFIVSVIAVKLLLS